jgi:hypothetical protein
MPIVCERHREVSFLHARRSKSPHQPIPPKFPEADLSGVSCKFAFLHRLLLPTAMTTLSLHHALTVAGSISGTDARVLTGGRFTLGDLNPRPYRVWATSRSGNESLYSPVQEVVLRDTSVDDLDLVLGPGGLLNGVTVATDQSKRLADMEPELAIVLGGTSSNGQT